MSLILNISIEDNRLKRGFISVSSFLLLLGIELTVFAANESLLLVALNGPVLFLFYCLLNQQTRVGFQKLAFHFITPIVGLSLLATVFKNYKIVTVAIPAALLLVYALVVLIKVVMTKSELVYFSWLKYLCWFSILLGVLSFVLYLRREEYLNVQFCVYQYIIAIFGFTLIYTAFLWTNIISYGRKTTGSSIGSKKMSLGKLKTQYLENESVCKILNYFETSTDYLNPNFCFDEFSDKVGLEKRELTRVLNQELNMSFYNLLAIKRVGYAKKLIKTQSELYTLEYIMVESGFQSKSTFNRNFKQNMGITPSEYRDKCLKKAQRDGRL